MPPPPQRKPNRMFAGQTSSAPATRLLPTGEAHDGDTFRLNTGQNGRLYGADAFELNQTGLRNGQTIPIGQDARSYILPQLPGSVATPTGATTYNRPVVTLENGGRDIGADLLRNGWGLAAPEYLKSDPKRFGEYMEAERLARMNRLGAHASQFQSPSDYRHNKPDPWAKPEEGQYGNSIAVFPDEPTPFQGLRPDIEAAYVALARDPKSSADDLVKFGDANSFTVSRSSAQKFIDGRNSGAKVADKPIYDTLPKPVINPGDGAMGAGVRGLADPINMLDEMGGFIDTIGLTGGRENLFNSDRRFGDILYNNIDQNRSILVYDDMEHPYARFGGQLASGLALPGASIEGVGLNAARNLLRTGGSRYAAEQAAKAAIRSRLGVAGSIEGGFAGFGAGEGDPVDRLPNAAIGAVAGYGLGYGTAALADTAIPAARNALNRYRPESAPTPAAAPQAQRLGDQWAEWQATQPAPPSAASDIPPPPPGYTVSMENEAAPLAASVTSPRVVDRIDVNNRARPMLADTTDAQRYAQGQRIEPTDVLPIPANMIASADEAASISDGLYPEIKAPKEIDELGRRNIPSPIDATRTMPKRGPLDLNTFLRTRGGLIDQGGDLRHMGVTNAGRDLDFAKGEQRFGKLVDNENGLNLDEAADLAWREGYFPDHAERPTIAEFLDAVDNTNRGFNRSFRYDDLSEIDAFNSARDQRLAVERGREQGAPLVEDRGQPATLEDMEANSAPVSAYEEWGENAPDFAGNIRLGNLDSPQNISRALFATDQRVGGFDAARRGRITQAETQSLANELGMTADDLLKRRKGQALNAEQALAARQILAKSGNELVNMARAIQRLDDPGEEKLAAFRQAWVRHVAIQEQVAGATAEAGRALAQFRQMADSRNVRGNVLDAIAQAGGGKDQLKAAANLILSNADDPGAMNKIAAKALQPKFKDKVIELWINNLLSGPQTHVVNMLSNTMTSLAQIPEHTLAAGVGAVRTMGGRVGDTERVLFSETGARAVGLLQGAKEGLAQFRRTFRTGQASDFGSKVEAPNQEAISGLKGKIIRTPTRLLSAEDELFKGMARRMELSGLAVRKAAQEGLRGEQAKRRAADLLANPTDEMLDQAFDYGRYVTFQRPLSTGHGVSQGASMLFNQHPALKFVVPFIRTPANLMKFAIERSPAAPLVKEWRKDFQAGGAKRDLAIARAMVGTGIGAAVAEMAAQGMITANGPADDGAKDLLRADGWQPYSIRIGDQYYSYQRMDPFASTLGVAAGLVELQDHMTDKQRDDVAMLLTASVMQNLASKTWLSGIGDLTQAVDDPTRYGTAWLKRTAGSVVPAAVAQVARTIDPNLREAETILDAVRRRIPGLSSSLPAQRDTWGRPVVGEGGIGPDIVSPLWLSSRRNDPVNNALLDAGVNVPDFRRDGMSPADYGQFRAEAGAQSYNGVAELIGGPTWKALDAEDAQEAVRKIVRAARKETKGRMFGAGPRPIAAIPPPPPGYVLVGPDGEQVPPPPPGYTLAP